MDVGEYFANMTAATGGKMARAKFSQKQCFIQISRENGFREQNSLIWHEVTVCSSTATAKTVFHSSAHQRFLPPPPPLQRRIWVLGYFTYIHTYLEIMKKSFQPAKCDSRPRSSWSIIEATRAFSKSIRINAGTFVV